MKVNDYATRTYKFSELKIGDVFRVKDSECTYMKIAQCLTETEPVNTVVLNNGWVTYYEQTEDVVLLIAEVTITGEQH